MKKFFFVIAVLSLIGVSARAEEAAKPQIIGSPGRWTATTEEAANNPVAKEILAKGKPVTVTGEVVDVSCYLQLGKRGEKHIDCGQKCVKNGQPFGVVDNAGKLYIVFVEEHHPRRDGTLSLRDTFAGLMAKTVTVEGMLTESNGNAALFVQAEPAAKQ